MRTILILSFVAGGYCACFSQSVTKGQAQTIPQGRSYTYAYITIQGKGFGKKLRVDVDLGDSPEQLQTSKEYSELLTNKKSYAAVLNYMAEQQFELVESRDDIMSYQGTGGTEGIILIMRKPK